MLGSHKVRQFALGTLAFVFSLSGCSEDAETRGRIVDGAASCCASTPEGGTTKDAGREAGTPDAADASDRADSTAGAPDANAADGANSASDAASCNAIVQEQPGEGATHIPDCTSHTYVSNPPSSGPHWGTSAAHGVYDVAVPREALVHNLEHGAVIVWYNCSANCADVARVKAFIENLPADPICPGTGPARRVILVPDPLLDVPIAASAWGFTLRASCFDEQAFADFFTAHYGHGPEAVCFDGWDFQTDNGELILPPSCL